MKKYLIHTIFIFSFSLPQDYAGLSGSFLRVGVTARSIAMGGAFTAEKDHGFSTFYNPAWAAFLVDRQVGLSYSSMSLDRRLSGLSFATPLPPTAGLGIAWVSAGVTDIQGRSSAGEKTTVMQTSEDALMVSFAQRILPWFSFGVNIKILQNQLPINESYKGSGIGFDVGLLFKSGKSTTFGLMIQDINSMYNWDSGDLYAQGRIYSEYFPTIYRFGTKFNYKSIRVVADAGFITNYRIGKELSEDIFINLMPRVGVEYTYQDLYFFRGGLGNGRIAFGWGLEYDSNKKSRFSHRLHILNGLGISVSTYIIICIQFLEGLLYFFAHYNLYHQRLGTNFLNFSENANDLALGRHPSVGGSSVVNPSLIRQDHESPIFFVNSGSWYGDISISGLNYVHKVGNFNNRLFLKQAEINDLEFRGPEPSDEPNAMFSAYGFQLGSGFSVKNELGDFGVSVSYLSIGIYDQTSKGFYSRSRVF